MPNPSFLVMGFDFGMKRIGVAIGQTLTKTAKPITILSAEQGQPTNWVTVDKLIKEWQPKALLVGIPLNMNGTRQTITDSAEQFASILKERYDLPIYPVDERLTTVAARELVYQDSGYRGLQKRKIDSVAAQLIVETWLMENF